jgi:hypothetical protein
MKEVFVSADELRKLNENARRTKRPNIVRHRGRWHCSSGVTKVGLLGPFEVFQLSAGSARWFERVGFGRTPSEAFFDWRVTNTANNNS